MFDYQVNQTQARSLQLEAIDGEDCVFQQAAVSHFHDPVRPDWRLFHIEGNKMIDGSQSGQGKFKGDPGNRKSKSKNEKPKRPLSAYNLFFQQERLVLLESLPVRPQGKPRRSHGKIGFVEMARIIGHRWKTLDQTTREYYNHLALKEKERYENEMAERHKQAERSCLPDRAPASTHVAKRFKARSNETRVSHDCAELSVAPNMGPLNYKSHKVSAELSVAPTLEPLGYKSHKVNSSESALQFDKEMIDILAQALW